MSLEDARRDPIKLKHSFRPRAVAGPNALTRTGLAPVTISYLIKKQGMQVEA